MSKYHRIFQDPLVLTSTFNHENTPGYFRVIKDEDNMEGDTTCAHESGVS